MAGGTPLVDEAEEDFSIEVAEAADLSMMEVVEATDFSTTGLTAKGRDSTMEVESGQLLSAAREDAFWSFLVGLACGSSWSSSALRLAIVCVSIVQFQVKIWRGPRNGQLVGEVVGEVILSSCNLGSRQCGD